MLPIFFRLSEIDIKLQSLGKTLSGSSDVTPSQCSPPSAIVNSPPLDRFDTLPSQRSSLGLQPPSLQYKRKREDKEGFPETPSSKRRFLARSLSWAISSRQLTTPFTSELKRKWEDDIVESSPSKRPNCGSTSSLARSSPPLVAPPLPEPSVQSPSTLYKRKREDDSLQTLASKRRFLVRSLSQVISSNPTSSVARFLPRKSVASSPLEVSNATNSNPSTHAQNRFERQYLPSQMNSLTRL